MSKYELFGHEISDKAGNWLDSALDDYCDLIKGDCKTCACRQICDSFAEERE